MPTGRYLLQTIYSSGWPKFCYRGETERDFQSDRMKRIGKAQNKQVRNKLKKDLKALIEEI